MDTYYLDSQTKFWHYLATSRKTNIKIYFEGLGFQTYLAKNCYNTLFCNKIGCGKQINLPIIILMWPKCISKITNYCRSFVIFVFILFFGVWWSLFPIIDFTLLLSSSSSAELLFWMATILFASSSEIMPFEFSFDFWCFLFGWSTKKLSTVPQTLT